MKNKWSNMQLSLIEKECVSYFREYNVFKRMLQGFWSKYQSYGEFSGTVVIQNLTEEDREVLEGFFQKNYHGKSSASISAKKFEMALKNSRFDSVLPKRLLEIYFQEPMVSRQEQKQAMELEWEEMLKKVQEQAMASGGRATEWIADQMQALGKVRSITVEKIEETREMLLDGIHIVNALPGNRNRNEYLPVFAARVTGNPHAFDDGTKKGTLLYRIVCWNAVRCGDTGNHENDRNATFSLRKGFQSVYKQKLYLLAGILKDDISNYAILSGVHAIRKDGKLHAGMEGFFQEEDMVQVPLSVLVKWSKVECPDNVIYIVENPAIFAELCGKFQGKTACMCMNGQPRLAALLVLELLAKSGTKVYYGGDFDPEGLLIAQKLKLYYQGDFSYWNMDVDVYQKSLSAEAISEQRLKELDKITDLELLEVVSQMRRVQRAGYQENLKGYVK